MVLYPINKHRNDLVSAQTGYDILPKIEKNVTIQVPNGYHQKPPLRGQASRNHGGVNKDLQNFNTSMYNQSKFGMSTTYSAKHQGSPSINYESVGAQTHYFGSRSAARKTSANSSPKNESTGVFMNRGLRSTGAISPLIVDHRFDEQVRNYPQRELYQTIAMKKFRTNGVKVVDRYNHMKK